MYVGAGRPSPCDYIPTAIIPLSPYLSRAGQHTSHRVLHHQLDFHGNRDSCRHFFHPGMYSVCVFVCVNMGSHTFIYLRVHSHSCTCIHALYIHAHAHAGNQQCKQWELEHFKEVWQCEPIPLPGYHDIHPDRCTGTTRCEYGFIVSRSVQLPWQGGRWKYVFLL